MTIPRTPRPARYRRRRAAAATASVTVATIASTMIGPVAHASDTLPWTGESAVGANQPYQHGYTAPELLDWDPASDRYAEYLRSHVPLQSRNAPNAQTQRNPALPAETQMLNLTGDYGNAFFESHQGTNEFSQNLFNYWQYTDIYAPWHGMPVESVPVEFYDPTAQWTQRWFEFGMLNLPNPAYTNAAHANGNLSIGSIFFSTNDRGDQSYRELLERGDDGSFPVAAKLIEVARYYGFDGYFVNQEETAGVAPSDIPAYKDFLKALRDGGMYIQWYDSTTDGSGALQYQNEFTPTNSPWVLDDEKGRLTDSMFLNYWWNVDRLQNSKDHALSRGLDPHETVFAGYEAGMYNFSSPYDMDDNLDENGIPRVSIATLGADFVHAQLGDKSTDPGVKTEDADQWAAFDRERRFWTGSSSGAATPDVVDGENWDGMSKYIAERSVIGGSTFATNFSTGHGLATWIDGTLSNASEWGDINRQDHLPTWQWWVDSASETPLTPDFDYGPNYTKAERFSYDGIGGYTGGNSLVLSGKLDADNTVRLFQTDLAIDRRSSIEITYAKPRTDGSELRLAVVLASKPSEVVHLPIKNSGRETGGWKTATVDLKALQGERIATLGVTVGAGTSAIEDFQLNLGQIRVTDGVRHKPTKPTGLTVQEYLPGSNELFVSWNIAPYEKVRRYELYLDDTYLGGGYDERHYVKNMPATAGTLRLVAVSHDGTRSTAGTLAFDPRAAASGLQVSQDDDALTVAWTAPARGRAPSEATLTAQDGSFSQTVRFDRRGEASATFSEVPTDGGEFRVTVSSTGRGTSATERGVFVDTEVEAYPADAATLDGRSLTLTRPTLDDWHTLTILEDGTPVQFDTTYNQGTRDHVIRGRTTRAAMSPTLASPNSRVVAILKDYAGNTAETLLRERVVPIEDDPVVEPDPGTDPVNWDDVWNRYLACGDENWDWEDLICRTAPDDALEDDSARVDDASNGEDATPAAE